EGDREAGEGADLAPTHDDLDDQEETTAAILLDDVRATLDRAHTAAEVQDLLRRAGFKRPFEAGGGDNAGGVFDAAEEEVATVDVNRATPDAQAQAIAKLLAYGLNLASGPPGDTRPRAPIDAAPVERLVAAAEQIRQLLLSGVDPASGLFAAIEQRYADFDAAISATRRAIAASQPQNLA
ncbi:MAG: hypothetical protein U1C74_02870, partial [Phenylobacterium sp.]|nr:hypothetical protein [Phenylobacterium sp.]